MSTSDTSTLEPESNRDDDESKRISRYILHLHEHTGRVLQHLIGHDPSSSSLPSYFPPNSYWTGEEKDRFFHALATCSRFRPDLIAQEVGTKTLTDVCLYLHMLEEALHNPNSASSSTGLKFTSLARQDHPAAHEVSDKWLCYEDGLAELVTALEPTILLNGLERSRAEEIRAQQQSIRAKKGTARTADMQRDREGEKARKAQFKEWLNGRNADWEVEDELRHLDSTLLRVIDTVLREDEEGWSVAQSSSRQSRQGSESAPAELSDREGSAIQQPQTNGDGNIPGHSGGQLPGAPLDEAAVASLPAEDVTLSPASRKRLRKRLYMRRKRAEQTGKAVDQSLTRLKPGRKSKQAGDVPDDIPEGGDQATFHGHSSGKTLPYKIREQFESLGIDAVRLQQEGLGLFHLATLSRLMRTYAQLHDVSEDVSSEIAASVIKSLQSSVAEFTSKLVRQSIVSREQEMVAKTQTKAWRLAESQVVTAANVAHALSLLSDKKYDVQAHFGSLPQRLDIPAEGESSSEQDTDSESAPERSTARQIRIASRSAEQYDGFEADDEQDAPTSSFIRTLPLHRVVSPPVVNLPGQARAPDSTHSIHFHIPWANILPIGTTSADDDILSSDTDEEQLDAELADEDQLDAEDATQGEADERRLWLTFEPSPEDADLVVAQPGTKRQRGQSDDGEQTVRKRKKYKPRVNRETGEPRGKIKSAPFILDSD
ncbi:hypothetical protein BDW22DRAFT_1419470 [Trametopsis cervina]|nr:hypothetical protein BDW22DRAFT_1419470 [Trametopsis cervina]